MRIELVARRPPTVFVTLRGKVRSIETLGIVDTGATWMLIPPDMAEDLGYDLSEAARLPVVTVGGVIEAPKISLEEVGVGSCSVSQAEAFCHDIPGGGVAVLIGLSFLQHFRVSLDFRADWLALEPYS